MSWARVDDAWWSHPKVIGLTLEARGLWVTALSWSCHQRRDRVPYRFIALVAGGECDVERPIGELVAAGLWHEDGGEFVIHDWCEYQDKSLAEKRAEAGRKGGIAKAQKQAVTSDDVANAGKDDLPEVAKALAGPALPGPSHPVVTRRKPSSPLPDDWQPSETHRTKAKEQGINLKIEADSFRNHHLARDSRFVDWDRAFHTWLNNARKWGGVRTPTFADDDEKFGRL